MLGRTPSRGGCRRSRSASIGVDSKPLRQQPTAAACPFLSKKGSVPFFILGGASNSVRGSLELRLNRLRLFKPPSTRPFYHSRFRILESKAPPLT